MAPPPPATVASARSYELGEGPVWDVERRRLLWVDIVGGCAYAGSLDGDRVTMCERVGLDEMTGAVVPGPAGGRLLAGQERLYRLAGDRTLVPGPRIVPAGQRRRLNDGAVDPAGRFLVGTLSLDAPAGHEVLARLEPDGAITILDDDLWLSNGLAWSSDGTRLYSVDTLRHVVFTRAYEPETGATSKRSVHLQLDPSLSPDGIAADAEDHLWVALWGAGEVRRYAPDATVVDRLPVPAPHVSSVALAGEDLRTLVITTARDGLDEAALRAFPDSGRIFTARVAVPGIASVPWAGAEGFHRR